MEREKLLKETIRLQKDILKQEVVEIQKVAKNQIDINDLIATSDSKLLNKKFEILDYPKLWRGVCWKLSGRHERKKVN